VQWKAAALNIVFCVLSVPSAALTLWQWTVLLCKWTAEIWVSYDEYRPVRCDVTILSLCAAGGCVYRFIPDYSSTINGSTSGWIGEILLKIHNINTSTKDANMFAIGK
jgi:hypothetical protein